MPEPRAPKQDRTVGQQAASRARRVGRAASRLDVALGPAEVPLGSIIGILAGTAVGIAPAIIFRSGILLPIGVILGGIFGGVIGSLLRGRLRFRGWRLGVVGVLLLGLLTTCFACGFVSTIAGFQKMGEADRLTKMAEEAGLGTYNEPPVTAPASAPICWGGVILLGIGTVFAVGLNFLIRIIRR